MLYVVTCGLQELPLEDGVGPMCSVENRGTGDGVNFIFLRVKLSWEKAYTLAQNKCRYSDCLFDYN